MTGRVLLSPTTLASASNLCLLLVPQALKELGQHGGQVVLDLHASDSITLVNASWNVKEQLDGFTTGSLTIRGSARQSEGE